MKQPLCELCRRLIFASSIKGWDFDIKGWDGWWRCACERERHYVCLDCAQEWELGADRDAKTLAVCIDHARVAQEIAGETPGELAPGVEVVEERGIPRPIPQVPTSSLLGVVGPATEGPVPKPKRVPLEEFLKGSEDRP